MPSLLPKAKVHWAAPADLCIDDRKIGGSAQRRRRRALLYHGTLLYDFDIPRITHYLHEPVRQPEHRRGRAHEAFLCNAPVDAAALKQRLREACEAERTLDAWPNERVVELVAEQFGNDAWTYRR